MISVPKSRWQKCLTIAILMHFIAILFLGIFRHWGYMTSTNDLGVFEQAVWGTLHSRPFLNTSLLNQKINWIGIHFQPILLIFVPLYSISSSSLWFILAQSLSLSLSAWPIFFIGRRVCYSEKVGFLWCLVYLVNPFMLNAAAWDFHPIFLAVPFVALGMLAIETSNFRLLLFSCLVIVMCKEHLGIMVVGFGFLWGIQNKEWKPAMRLIIIGIVHSFIVLSFIMPAFSPANEHIMFSKALDSTNRYSWLGNSPIDIFKKILLNPLYVIERVMLGMGGIKYFTLLFVFLIGLPLLAPEFLLVGLADLMANMLSSNPMPRSLISYHSVSLVPVLTVAAIYGARRLSQWSKKFSVTEIVSFAVIASFSGGYFLAPLPLPAATNIWRPNHLINWPDKSVRIIRSALGSNISVSVQANIGSHFSQRNEIYVFPNKLDEVDAIVLRLESPTTNINNIPSAVSEFNIHRKYFIATLDHHLQVDRKEYIATIERLIYNKEYGVLLWNDPWLVLARTAVDYSPYKDVTQKLDQLKAEWKVISDE
jgi:uncharacterized membrane protein